MYKKFRNLARKISASPTSLIIIKYCNTLHFNRSYNSRISKQFTNSYLIVTVHHFIREEKLKHLEFATCPLSHSKSTVRVQGTTRASPITHFWRKVVFCIPTLTAYIMDKCQPKEGCVLDNSASQVDKELTNSTK